MQPYIHLNFEGRCEEALEFYKGAIGAQITYLMRCKESPAPLPPGMVPPGSEDKVFHATFQIGTMTLHAADGHCQGQPNFQGFGIILKVQDADEAERVFAALSVGGKVTMPLEQTFWTARFGEVTDQFGLPWTVQVV